VSSTSFINLGPKRGSMPKRPVSVGGSEEGVNGYDWPESRLFTGNS
jgi:hypothetical protein